MEKEYEKEEGERRRSWRTAINRDECLKKEQSDVLEVNWFYSRNFSVKEGKD